MDLPFSHSSIAEAARYWNAVPCARMPASNHLFYEIKANDTKRVMRLTASCHRTQTYILAEIHWINFLSGQANVAKVIASENNDWTVPMQVNGREMTACVFEKVKGKPVNKDSAWGSKVFFEWGKTMATLHELSRKYVADNTDIRHLNGEVLLELAANTPGCGRVYKVLEEKWKQLCNSIAPQDWGMIHCDITQANMRYRDNTLHIFDFDNCQFAPFLYDIASTLYVTLFDIKKRIGPAIEVNDFLKAFFDGYSSQSNLRIDADVLRCVLDFYNALVYISCTRAPHHPFEAYAHHNLHHGTLSGIAFEKYLNVIV